MLGPQFVFPRESWNWLLLVGPAVIFFARWFLEHKFLQNTPFDMSVALLVIWMFFGVFTTDELAAGTPKIAGLMFGVVLLYVLTEALKSTTRIKIAIVVFVLMGLAVSIIGTLSRLDGLSVPQIDGNKIVKSIPKVVIKFDRAQTGINPNPLGGTLLLFIPPGMMALSYSFKKKTTKYYARHLRIAAQAIILGIEIFAIMYSRSAGALAAFGFVLLMIGDKGRLLKACVSLAIILAFVLILKSPGLNKNALINNTRVSLVQSISVRLPLWNGGLDAARTHPIFGLGIDRLRVTPPFIYEDAHAHNQFIHLAAEMGIPALIAYIAILIGSGWMALEVVRSKMSKGMVMMMKGFAWGQIGFAIFGIADAIPLGAKPGIFFWFSIALMTSIYLYGKNRGLLRKAEKLIES